MQRDLKRPRRIGILVTFSCAWMVTGAVHVALASGTVCDQAADQAASRIGIPAGIMRALTRTETGRNENGALTPWPWSMNVEGKGRWFATRKEAEAYLQDVSSSGIRNFDVGCFQINYRWHGTAFTSPNAMLEPIGNALYAARFLRALYEEKGDWIEAAAAYHSRTPKYATRYKARFERILANLQNSSAEAAVAGGVSQERRVNSYPFLKEPGIAARAPGSLFPMNQTSSRSFLSLGG